MHSHHGIYSNIASYNKQLRKLLDKLAVYVSVNHILTLHMQITCCNWEHMLSFLFIYYPGRKHIIMKLFSTTININILFS